MLTTTVHAPAKLNLTLRVHPVAPNGYHPIDSWFVPIGLADELTFTTDPTRHGVTLGCDDPAVPIDGSNLVLRAAAMLAGGRHDLPAVRITLAKSIPLGGGLGGGSSDAAATLVTLNRLWGLHRPYGLLVPLAEALGSDVPFFLHAMTHLAGRFAGARCRGRGERVEAVLARPIPRWALLILPGVGVSTPAVYKRFDALPPPPGDRQVCGPDWLDLPDRALMSLLFNDLEAPAFDLVTRLADLATRAAAELGRPVRMTGSGSTLFTLYDDPAVAAKSSERLGRLLGVDTRVVRLRMGD